MYSPSVSLSDADLDMCVLKAKDIILHTDTLFFLNTFSGTFIFKRGDCRVHKWNNKGLKIQSSLVLHLLK